MSELDVLFDKVNKELKSEIITKGLKRKEIIRIPSSSSELNYMMYGGLPRGGMFEFYGQEGGGKTTTTLDFVGNAQIEFEKEFQEQKEKLENIANPNKEQKSELQKLLDVGPKKIVYIDAECTLDCEWAEKLGVDVDNLYLVQPEEQSAEDIFQMTLNFIQTGEVGLIVIDSIGALISEQEWKKDVGEATYCGIAGPLSKFSKKCSSLSAKYGVAVVCINQVREEINSQYTMYRTPGGKAFKHFCRLRFMFTKGEYFDEKGFGVNKTYATPIGNRVLVHIEKSKVFPMNRKEGQYDLRYETGIDRVGSIIDTASKYELINKAGAWFSVIDPNTHQVMIDDNEQEIKFQGKDRLREYLNNSPEIVEWLESCLKLIYTA